MQVSDFDLYKMFINFLKLSGAENTGTYLKADPTAYSVITAFLQMEYGFEMEEGEDVPPEPAIYKLISIGGYVHVTKNLFQHTGDNNFRFVMSATPFTIDIPLSFDEGQRLPDSTKEKIVELMKHGSPVSEQDFMSYPYIPEHDDGSKYI